MKKKVFGKQLSRDTNERKALFKGLINALVMHESIQTTQAKAKAIKGEVEKLITKGKRGIAAKSLLQPWLQQEALEKVMQDLSVRFASRPGGYTRIIKLGSRFGDSAQMAVIEFVEKKTVVPAVSAKEKSVKAAPKEEKEATAKIAAPKTEKPEKKEKRQPSKAVMEDRRAHKGSPKKEAKKESK